MFRFEAFGKGLVRIIHNVGARGASLSGRPAQPKADPPLAEMDRYLEGACNPMSVATIEGETHSLAKRPKRPCRFALSCPLSARLTPRPTLCRVFSSVHE